ncbi:lasso peptide biosynthesis B2 protein [Asticcacaulis machinosus]|uniref:Lasso peptide biosynthesis B2 protein n=1 Tax=Asticcacaulis machinosus TaxID=2984211 RepID=A0ABT5HH61_9CAUL|nr:lasso peptide biosynthesis B2 protein [Asticcacaulis machinosus]MDC7675522.1 lasso peptide biosynthesis B2 protein [Asticcacaulis machinosus]
MYALAPDVSFCLDGEQVIFLDLRRDRYIGTSPDMGHSFYRYLKGDNPDDNVSRLVSNGLLVEAARPERPGPVFYEAPDISLSDQGLKNRRLSPADVGQIGLSLVVQSQTSWRLRHASLHQAISYLQQKKRSRQGGLSATGGERLIRLVRAYNLTRRLRATQDRCLWWSFALADLLLTHRLDCHLILAVQTKPFAAHAWVQHRHLVLNDSLDNVKPYTPILVI